VTGRAAGTTPEPTTLDLASWSAGPAGGPVMVFVHPNPLDSWSWAYQVADFAADHHCVLVDLPGYGATPRIPEDWSMVDLAEAVWRAVDRESPGATSAVLVGCSIGSHVVEHMYHLRPASVRALVLSGTGWDPERGYVARRIREYGEQGLAARRPHAFDVLSAEFGGTELGRFVVDTTCARDQNSDPAGISRLFEIRAHPDPDTFLTTIEVPVLVVSGTEDAAHRGAAPLVDKLPDARLRVLEGAGHACYLEQPWAFDEAVRTFLQGVGGATER
jgi:pimeloyl-ACP methyl ester carboxylesterase